MTPFLRFPGFKSKTFSMSYDDASVYDKRLIDIMDKFSVRGTFNVCSAAFSDTAGQSNKLTRSEAHDLYSSSGNEVAVHGARHLSLAAVDTAVATRDIIRDRESLENLFGRIIKGMAYANGSFNEKTTRILKSCGINYARTTVSTEKFDVPTDWLHLPATCHHKNPRLMELAKDFVEYEHRQYFWAQTPIFFLLWGHSHEFEKDGNWDVIEKLLAFIGRRDDIWYATNGEIFDYVRAYERLEIGTTGSIVHNPSACDVYVNYYGKDVILEAGKTVFLK